MKKLDSLILEYSLQNAVFYNGKVDPKAVLGKVLGKYKDGRKQIPKIKKMIEVTTKNVNKMSKVEQKKQLEKLNPKLLVKEEKKQDPLPELPNVKGKVITRFAPSPTGPLMIQHLLRAVFLNYLYAKKYKGNFILRIEDTDPVNTKKKYYEWIKQDLRKVGVNWDKLVIESDNMKEYYKAAEKMIERDDIYSCRCSAEEFRDLKNMQRNCGCRDIGRRKTEYDWEKAIDGKIAEGEMVFRLKTSMQDPNPAMRDPTLFRVSKAKHPTKGRKYNIWPLYNFANVIEDKNSGITHVFRGKEHEHNTNVQSIIYSKLGWEMPSILNFGMISLPGEKIHTRDIRAKIDNNELSGWDDPSLPTVRALLRRGFQPEAFREAALNTGLTKNDITFSWQMLEAHNRKIIDPKSKRFMVVTDPVKLNVSGLKVKKVEAQYHPDNPKKGKKTMPVNPKEIYITEEDYKIAKKRKIRLKELCNIKVVGHKGKFIGNELIKNMPKIQWVSKPNVKVEIIKPDGIVKAIGENSMKKLRPGELIQMERIGFGRVDSVGKTVRIMFAHK